MPDKKQDPVRAEFPTVEIRGKTYTLKSLPAYMAYDLLPVLEQAVGALGQVQAGKADRMQLIQFFLRVVRENRGMLDDVFAHLLGVKTSELRNGDRFPISTPLKLCRVLGEHPDLEDFLTEARELWGNMPTIPGEDDETQETTPAESSEPSDETQATPAGATSSS